LAKKKGRKAKKKSANPAKQIAAGLRSKGVSKKAANAIANVVAAVGFGKGKGKKRGKKGT
jgi:hypothetical protein